MACNQGIESLHVANDSPYLVPLMFGWKREVVLRTSSSRADVYYIPPKVKKCCSLNDVQRAIQGTQLTIEGFTFAEKLLGVNDPNKEVVRSASNAAVFKKTSLNESIDPSSPPNKKARISPENSKVKQELQVEEDKPDVTGWNLAGVGGTTGLSPVSCAKFGCSNAEMACDQGIESLHVANDSPYLVPLMFGWKREVVLRSNTSSSRADVYYIPPKGKKCRSLNDVERAIQGTQLTIEGFTFAKKSLGVNDPNKEVVRSASNAAVFKKTSLNESIDPSSPPIKKAKISPKNSKVKQELQTEEDNPDVTDKSSLDESSKLENYETGEEEVSDSSNVLKSLNLRRSTCPPEGPSSSEPTSTNQVPSSTTNVTGNISSEEEHDPLDIAIPQVSFRCCSCDLCSTVDEKSECCWEIPFVEAVKSDFKCITQHPCFEKLILDSDVLSITRHMLSVRTKNKNKKNLLNTNTPLNITWRYIAYKQFVAWINGCTSMGSNSQVAIPSCVVSAVRERFPEQNGSYKVLKFSP